MHAHAEEEKSSTLCRRKTEVCEDQTGPEVDLS